jgi:CRP-like cAMP-binding protein
MEYISILKGIAIFGGLEEEKLRRISELIREKTYKSGDFIVREGQHAEDLFIVKRGRVEVIKGLADEPDRKVKIATLEEGDCFGEMSLIDIMPRSASVRALGETVVLGLSYVDFHSLSEWNLKVFTILVMNIAREISRRLRAADEILAEYNVGKEGAGGDISRECIS